MAQFEVWALLSCQQLYYPLRKVWNLLNPWKCSCLEVRVVLLCCSVEDKAAQDGSVDKHFILTDLIQWGINQHLPPNLFAFTWMLEVTTKPNISNTTNTGFAKSQSNWSLAASRTSVLSLTTVITTPHFFWHSPCSCSPPLTSLTGCSIFFCYWATGLWLRSFFFSVLLTIAMDTNLVELNTDNIFTKNNDPVM